MNTYIPTCICLHACLRAGMRLMYTDTYTLQIYVYSFVYITYKVYFLMPCIGLHWLHWLEWCLVRPFSVCTHASRQPGTPNLRYMHKAYIHSDPCISECMDQISHAWINGYTVFRIRIFFHLKTVDLHAAYCLGLHRFYWSCIMAVLIITAYKAQPIPIFGPCMHPQTHTQITLRHP